jgi:hypothetical protein
VDEFAENGEWRLSGELFRLRDGVTHAEADAEMLSEQDFHGG